MKVKVGDTVKIIAGKDKGKTGKILKTLKKDNKVVVEGLNICKRHSKPTNTNDKGGIFDIEAPIHVSNVKLVPADEKKAVKKETKKENVEVKESKPKKTSKKASK